MDPFVEELSRGEQISVKDPKIPKPALNGAIHKGNLYLNLLDALPGDLSKELFITLLDKAEEAGCNNVIVCLNKRACLRQFGLIGFKLLPPNHTLIPGPVTDGNMFFMGYQIEGGEI